MVMQTGVERDLLSLPEGPGDDVLDVLFVLNNLAVGGSETKVVRLANSLQQRGMQVGVAYLNEPFSLLKQLQTDIPAYFLARKGRFSLSAVATLRHLVLEQRPRTVVSVNLYPALYVVTATRRLDDCPRTIGLMNTTELRRGARWRRAFYRRVLRFLDWTVYGCELQRNAWLPATSPMRPRSSVIYNGVDLERFSPTRNTASGREQRARFGIGQSSFVVGSVGRLAPEKNQLPLIDALARLRTAGMDIHLMLVGDGPMRQALEQRVAERRVANAVTFTGALSDVSAVLPLFDVFVLPSLSETFSNAALEAMAMRVPVILTRTGGAPEMIQDGREGFIVDASEVAQRVPELVGKLRSDAELRARMGAAAATRAQQAFSWNGMIAAYEAVLGCRQAGGHA
jgi:glycosyltransferase involved in cell wall biosynthesis